MGGAEFRSSPTVVGLDRTRRSLVNFLRHTVATAVQPKYDQRNSNWVKSTVEGKCDDWREFLSRELMLLCLGSCEL